SLPELLAGVFIEPGRHLRTSVRAFLWAGRAAVPAALWGIGPGTPGDALDPGFASGGLCLLPIALLGLVGFASLRTLRAWSLWVAMVLAGLALPVLSITTARRLLIVDLAWCAFAAHGCVTLARWLPIAAWPPGRRLVAWSAMVGALGAWSGL